MSSGTTHSTGIGDDLFVCCLYCWFAYVDFNRSNQLSAVVIQILLFLLTPTL